MSRVHAYSRVFENVLLRLPDPDRHRWRLLALLVVGLAASWAAAEGLLIRDLTGDELGSLGNDVRRMLDRAIEVHRPTDFSAHLPLAWLARAGMQEIIPPVDLLSWRLHTAIAAVLGALATAALVSSRERAWVAAACGLLVGLSPILTFHARDSTNYAFVPLTGALVLAGLVDLAEGKKWAPAVLLAGLGLGCANDFYFAFFALPALLLTPVAVLHAPRRRQAAAGALGAWTVLGAGLVYPAIAFWNRLKISDVHAVVARHADPDETRFRSLRELLEPQLGRLAVAYQEGFEGLALRDAEVGTAAWVLLTSAVALGLVGRRPLERLAAGLVVGTVLVTVGFEMIFNHRFDRAFPVFARNWLTILPAMAVIQVALFRRLGPLGAPFVLALVLLHGSAAATQQINVSDARQRLLDRMVRLWEPGDAGLTAVPLDVVLPHHLGAQFTASTCLPDDWTLPRRVWRWDSSIAEDIPPLLRCDGTDPGYRVRLSTDGYIPPHQYKTNSHLVPIRMTLFQHGGASPTSPDWTVALAPRSGRVGPATVKVTWEHPDGDIALEPIGYAREIRIGAAPAGTRRIRVRVDAAGPRGLLKRFDRPRPPLAEFTELPPIPADPLEPRIEQPIWAGRNPTFLAMRTFLRSVTHAGARLATVAAVLQIGMLLVVWVRRFRESSTPPPA